MEGRSGQAGRNVWWVVAVLKAEGRPHPTSPSKERESVARRERLVLTPGLATVKLKTSLMEGVCYVYIALLVHRVYCTASVSVG